MRGEAREGPRLERLAALEVVAPLGDGVVELWLAAGLARGAGGAECVLWALECA